MGVQGVPNKGTLCFDGILGELCVSRDNVEV